MTLKIIYLTSNSVLYSPTHSFSAPICMLIPKVPVEIVEVGTHQGLESCYGDFMRIFQEAITRGSYRGNKDDQTDGKV